MCDHLARASEIETVLTAWLERSADTPIEGETLQFTQYRISRYHIPQSHTSYGEDGFEIALEQYQPVMWPWLDLYLTVRRTFPVRERLSFRFINQPLLGLPAI